jgi:hypothetical protein
MDNTWGIVRAVLDLVLRAGGGPTAHGKFLLLKDPTKELLRWVLGSGKFQALRLCALSALELANVVIGWWLCALAAHLGAVGQSKSAPWAHCCGPGQQTSCVIVVLGYDGDGHFQAQATVPCLTKVHGFMPDQLQTHHPTTTSTIDTDM